MSLPHRPEDAIQDLIDAKQWKQALNLCEKKVKKGDKSDLTLVCTSLSVGYLSIKTLIPHRSEELEFSWNCQTMPVTNKHSKNSTQFFKDRLQ